MKRSASSALAYRRQLGELVPLHWRFLCDGWPLRVSPEARARPDAVDQMHRSRFVCPTADLVAGLIASSYMGAVVYLAGASWDRALLQGLESAGIEGRPAAMLLAAAMMIGLGVAIRELARTGQQPIARALTRPRIVLVALGVAAIAVLPELGPWWRSHLPDEHAASVMPALLGLAGLSAVLASLLPTGWTSAITARRRDHGGRAAPRGRRGSEGS